MFQRNIVLSSQIEPYRNWFLFAEKTKNKNNTAKDFEEFKEHAVFAKIIERINQNVLSANDITYIHDEDELSEEIKRWEDGKIEEGLKEGIEKGIKKGIKIGIEKGIEQGMEQGIDEGKKEERINIAQQLLDVLDDTTIAQKTGLELDVIQQLRRKPR